MLLMRQSSVNRLMLASLCRDQVAATEPWEVRVNVLYRGALAPKRILVPTKANRPGVQVRGGFRASEKGDRCDRKDLVTS